MTALERFRLDDKVAVVTGALGRLGPVWVSTLLEAGASVAALDLPGVETPEVVATLVRSYGQERLFLVAADITDRQSVEEAAAKIDMRLGSVDVLVNNSGIDAPPDTTAATFTIAEISADAFRRTLDVNLLGSFVCMQVFGAEMVARRRGAIVNIGSLYASVSPDARFYEHLHADPPFLKPPAYGASKAGLLSLTRYLATHWARYGVRVNQLSPGGVEGDQDEEFKRKFRDRIPLGRMCVPEDLEGPLLFLASESSSYVTGVELIVDGGFTAW